MAAAAFGEISAVLYIDTEVFRSLLVESERQSLVPRPIGQRKNMVPALVQTLGGLCIIYLLLERSS